MYVAQHPTDPPRRGVVLVLILAMLGLLALIGVSFATITGQAQTGSRRFAEAAYTPTSDQVMDFALSQLVYDTTNPLSAIRGHSLANDMYGNDAANIGTINAAGYNQHGYNVLSSGTGVSFTAGTADNVSVGGTTPYSAYTQYTTNIAVAGTPDLTGWIIRVTAPGLVSQTVEVVRDDRTTTATKTYHLLTLSNFDGNARLANFGSTNAQAALDGNFRRAFNGPGANNWSFLPTASPAIPANFAQYANFRFNGDINNGNPTPGNPNAFQTGLGGMDEDYDAVDTENWFLAMISADGSVVVPSFHRPGILAADDWKYPYNSTDTAAKRSSVLASMAKILRPRSVDHPGSAGTFPNLVPDATTGKITYDVDNDGDGVAESVWLDLGHPVISDASGKRFKPLYAMTVMGLNGRIPLNTAGNIQGRHLNSDPSGAGLYNLGDPTFNHTSHLGYSPSEISPLYALQNAPDLNYFQFDNTNTPSGPSPVSVTQLRNLLTGTRVPLSTNKDANTVTAGTSLISMGNNIYDSTTTPSYDESVGTGTVVRNSTTVSGRWGEPNLISLGLVNPNVFGNGSRAGRTNNVPFVASRAEIDAADDNRNTFDFRLPGQSNPEDGDYNDNPPLAAINVNVPLPPVERTRRFVKPFDLAGTGRLGPFGTLMTFGGATYTPATGTQTGFDAASVRQGYLGSDAAGRLTTWIYHRPPGVPPIVSHTTYDSDPSYGSPDAGPDITSNPLHGYESERNPDPGALVQSVAAMPFNTSAVAYPTFTGPINSEDSTTTPAVNYGYLNGSLALNEAEEMDHYNPSHFDSPFGPEDTEWLYRRQDIDGSSLDSRLAQLAPVSFGNNGGASARANGALRPDAMMRRNLFAHEVWDTNALVLANDNPGSAASPNGVFQFNSRLLPSSNCSVNTLHSGARHYPIQAETLSSSYMSNVNLPSPGQTALATPSLAHRDRKINLNYPLPVSNAPDEPVRKKWITETYNFLLETLPPEATDTAEEQVKLCQYLVNIIDFRDPDGAMTHFIHPNVLLVPAGAAAAMSPGTPPRAILSYNTTDPDYGKAIPMDLYGMEYNPIAINEVLAYSFKRASGATGIDTPRFFVELVNTLSIAGNPASIPSGYPSTGWNPSDINLAGWDLVVAFENNSLSSTTSPGEDFTCRPDPLTGQIPPQPATGRAQFIYMPLQPRPTGSTNSTTRFFSTPSIKANGTPQYMVLSNPLVDYTCENGYSSPGAGGTGNIAPNLDGILTRSGLGDVLANNGSYVAADDPFALGATIPPAGFPGAYNTTNAFDIADPNYPSTRSNIPQTNIDALPTNVLGRAQGKFFWLYLRRPANPLVSADPSAATATGNPMVVVDSFRFPFIEAGAKVDISDPKNPAIDRSLNRDLYSFQRTQPYRGGQEIPTPIGPPYPSPPQSLGYSEQTAITTPMKSGPGNLTSTVYPYMFGVCPSTSTPPQYYQITGTTQTTPPTPYSQVNTPNKGPGSYKSTNASNTCDATTIAQTLGAENFNKDANWDHFVFHDRDFMGVAELLLVPGCPPGLFTKQFVENAPRSPVLSLPDVKPPAGSPWPTLPQAINLYGSTNVALSTAAPLETPPHTYPYLTDNLYYSATNTQDAVPVINGTTGAGWHKMLGIFEVPSPAINAIGPVASSSNPDSNGHNFDWFRQDRKPGLLNLNLIIDEEVFFGLIDDPLRMNTTAVASVARPAGQPSALPVVYPVAAPPVINTPYIATHSGSDLIYYPTMANRGFQLFLDGTGNPSFSAAFQNNAYSFMKRAFRDFLGMRHTFDSTTNSNPILFGPGPERPFHDLTYPDIDYTVMRPALLPGSMAFDPGTKSTSTDYNAPGAGGIRIGPPPVPTRRLFSIPTTANPTPNPHDNSSQYGDTSFNAYTVVNGAPVVDLSSAPSAAAPTVGTSWLGGIAAGDNRQHPVFQTEWLQKVMNLTTVRTHQFAVWVTVGFFEVSSAGNAQVVPPIPDVLGREVGAREGRAIRYRSFFLLDRTRIPGFNPQDPGDFRDVVLYRRRIE